MAVAGSEMRVRASWRVSGAWRALTFPGSSVQARLFPPQRFLSVFPPQDRPLNARCLVGAGAWRKVTADLLPVWNAAADTANTS